MAKLKPFTVFFILFSVTLYGADYTRINMYPGAASVSGAGAFCTDGSEGINENPASAVYLSSVSAMHYITGMGISAQDISYNTHSGAGAFGVSLSNFSFGQEQEITQDAYGAPVITGNMTGLSALGLTGIYARKFGKLSAGASFGMLAQNFGSTEIFYNAGIGFRIDDLLTRGVNLGMAVNGMDIGGNGIRSAGISLMYKAKTDEPFFAASGVSFDGYSLCASLGAGTRIFDVLSLAAGARYVTGQFYYSAGASFNLGQAAVNYSYEPFTITGASHRMSLSFPLDYRQDTAKNSNTDSQGEKSFAAYMRNGDYYYSGRQYSQAAKYYEYINVLYWKDLQRMSEGERSRFFQKLGICYYNIKDNARAKQYFEQAIFLTPENEILKHWLRAIK